MPLRKYKDFRFSKGSLEIIGICNKIIEEYQEQGFSLTLRQLYYQLVSRAIIANQQKEYKRLGSIVNDARLAGLIDWLAIEDRTRNLRDRQHWHQPQDILNTAARAFHMDMWATQDYRPEVWIEKDALVGVIEGVCQEFDVPFFSCRGYTSQSEMWVAGQRIIRNFYTEGDNAEETHTPLILHFGDHDPSGKDMSRDITDRLAMFVGSSVKFERLALNMDQIEQYKPPPNPAKITDSRSTAYIAEFGGQSWELDALEPTVISALIRDQLEGLIDYERWNARLKEIEGHRKLLTKVSQNWEKMGKLLK